MTEGIAVESQKVEFSPHAKGNAKITVKKKVEEVESEHKHNYMIYTNIPLLPNLHKICRFTSEIKLPSVEQIVGSSPPFP